MRVTAFMLLVYVLPSFSSVSVFTVSIEIWEKQWKGSIFWLSIVVENSRLVAAEKNVHLQSFILQSQHCAEDGVKQLWSRCML